MPSDNIISLADARNERQPHLSGEALCLCCRHTWVAVAPVGVWQLYCPACGTKQGVFKYPIAAAEGDVFFACRCGCEAMTAYYREGLLRFTCMACGTEQTDALFGSPDL